MQSTLRLMECHYFCRFLVMNQIKLDTPAWNLPIFSSSLPFYASEEVSKILASGAAANLHLCVELVNFESQPQPEATTCVNGKPAHWRSCVSHPVNQTMTRVIMIHPEGNMNVWNVIVIHLIVAETFHSKPKMLTCWWRWRKGFMIHPLGTMNVWKKMNGRLFNNWDIHSGPTDPDYHPRAELLTHLKTDLMMLQLKV